LGERRTTSLNAATDSSTFSGEIKSRLTLAESHAASGSLPASCRARDATCFEDGSVGEVSSDNMFPNCQRTPNHTSAAAAIKAVANRSQPFADLAFTVANRSLIESFEKLGDTVYYVFLLFRLQLRIDRQRESFPRRAFGLRKVAFPVAEIAKVLLQMQRHRVINIGTDITFRKITS